MYKTLRNVLAERKISVRRLAIDSGIVPQSLYAALNGRAEFWPGYKKRVAETLGMSELELFPEDAEK